MDKITGLAEIAMAMVERGYNVVIKGGVVIVMTDAEFSQWAVDNLDI